MSILSWLSELTDQATNDEKDAPANEAEGGGLLDTVGKFLGFDDASASLAPGNQPSYGDQKRALEPGATARTTSRLNVRQAPKTSASKLMTLSAGESVEIIVCGDWANVIARDEVGWCHADYLELAASAAQTDTPKDSGKGGGDESDSAAPGGGSSDTPLKKIEPGDFKTQDYQLSTTKQVTLATHGKRKATATPAEYTKEILEDANLDASSWFGNFTTTSFLGRKVRDPIHTELAAHLKNSEGKIIADHGKDGESAKEVGDRLGMSRGHLVGSRKEPTGAAYSMHLFGLAVDIDPKSHRYLSTSGKVTRRDVSNWVFANAGELLRGAPVEYKGSEDFEAQQDYDVLLEEYFALLDLDDQALTARTKDAGGNWAGKSATEARAMINKDLDTLAQAWHGMSKWEDNRERIKSEGLMNFSEELVGGLGLHWGAQYGDLMHFDMRNTGVGATIHGEIKAYKRAKKAELKEG